MSLQLPPDPYVALGVPKTADLATIKSTYRKLVLKCHPDKFPDEAVKLQKQEEFQKIQQAYELIGDEDARSRYDSLIRLEELRKEGLERQRKGAAEGPRVEVRGNYNVRTAEPAGYSRSTTAEARPRSYEESDRYYEEQRASSRKHDGYEPHSRRSPRVDRDDRARGEKKKTRDRDERRERTTKYAYGDEDDSDERARFEKVYRRRNEEEQRAREDRAREERAREERAREDRAREDRAREELKRRAEEARREEERRETAEEKSREARRRADYGEDSYEKKTRDARDYIERSRTTHDERPSMPRVNSSSSTTHYVRRSGDRPVEVRRSRAKERRSSRERRGPEIVEPASEWTKPSLEKSYSTPANIKVPRVSPQRSYSHDHERSPPRLNRAETEPPRRKDATPAQPSKLREATNAQDSGYSSPTSPETSTYPTAHSPPKSASKTMKYQYTTIPGGAPVTVPYAPEEHSYSSGGHPTVLREPGRYRARSPEQMSREAQHERVNPTSRSTPVTSSVRYTTAPRPPIPHANSSARVEDLHQIREERERGRDRSDRTPLYGETTHTAYRRGEKPSSGSYNPDNVQYSRRFKEDDVHWSSYKAGYEAAKKEMYASRGYDEERPKMSSRSQTTVY